MTANETVDFYEKRSYAEGNSGTVDKIFLRYISRYSANPKNIVKILEQLNANLLVRLIILIINWI